MPRDFKSFKNDTNEKILEENKDKVDDYQNLINKYKNMDSSDLMSTLFKEASRLKAEGKLDASTMQNLKSTMSPFLNDEQKEMLNSLVHAINEQR